MSIDLIQILTLTYFFEKGTRGGVSYISNRYSKVNNNYFKLYDSKQDSKHILYLDASNLYGRARSKFLATSGFEWIDPKEFDLINILAIVPKDVFLKLM